MCQIKNLWNETRGPRPVNEWEIWGQKMHLYFENVTHLILIASPSEQIGILRNGSQGPELVKFESLWMIGTNLGEKCRVVVLKIFFVQECTAEWLFRVCLERLLWPTFESIYIANFSRFKSLNGLKLNKMSLTKFDSIKISKWLANCLSSSY